MKKRKGRGAREAKKPGYLPGATWRDVLAGKPVTEEERAQERERGGKKPARCGNCKTIGMAKFGRGETPPCKKCGGAMKRLP